MPVNPLHARGYPSIGCEPCTRAIKPGEPERAGRWWWEQDEKRECGLHVAEEAAAVPLNNNPPTSGSQQRAIAPPAFRDTEASNSFRMPAAANDDSLE